MSLSLALFGAVLSGCNSQPEPAAEVHSEGDGHDHKKDEGHKEGDGHDHKEGEKE